MERWSDGSRSKRTTLFRIYGNTPVLQYSNTPRSLGWALRRFFVEKIETKDGLCTITGSEAKHMTRVLRMGRGDRFILMDGKGARFQAIIESAGRREVLISLEKPLPQPPPSPVEITLCQALLKSQAMDYIIEKTSELGVNRILPFSSERTVVRLNEERLAGKRRHWREIAHSAAKQSDKIGPAEIGPVLSLGEWMARCGRDDALKVILWEEEATRDLKGLLKTSPRVFTPTPVSSTGVGVKKFIGIVGPEGGFSQEEVRAAKEAGFTSVSLGQRVLRAETAAIAMVAIVQYEWGDLSLGNL